jgi:DNA repair protein RadD
MTYQLRYYQESAVNKAIWFFGNYQNPFVLVLPTGSGKSLVIADICHKLNEPTLILQPSKEILEQNYNKLLSYGYTDISIYSASFNSKEISKYTYATIGSIKDYDLFKQFKYVLLDECHLLNPNPKRGMGMYNKFFKAIDCKHICGLTASPYRVIKKFYTDPRDSELYYVAHLMPINRIYPFFFKKFAYKVSIQQLMKDEYLSPIEYKYYNDFDTSELRINTTGGDYDEISLEQFWNDKRLKMLAHAIGEIDRECKHNLIFCSSIKQARISTLMLREMGYSAEYLTSQHKPREREEIIRNFRNGNIKHLNNMGVLSVGFDFPELDSITLARPTISLALLYQMIGRGMRPFPEKKFCWVNDIVGNTKRLGRVETIEFTKEPGGFRDIVVTEKGEITNKPLFKFKLKDEEKKNKILLNQTEREELWQKSSNS